MAVKGGERDGYRQTDGQSREMDGYRQAHRWIGTDRQMDESVCVCVCVYIYIYTHTHTYTYTYVDGEYRLPKINIHGWMDG